MLFAILFQFACTKAPSETSASSEAPTTEQPVEQNAQETEDKGYKEFSLDGSTFTSEEIVTASTLLATPADYVGKTLRVSGKVSDVCQKMGCWMVMSDAEKHMRITTKDHAFFIDEDARKNSAGLNCEVEGEVIAREIEASRVEHFESESSEDAPIPEKQATDNVSYEIVAQVIRFYDAKNAPAAPATEENTEVENTADETTAE